MCGASPQKTSRGTKLVLSKAVNHGGRLQPVLMRPIPQLSVKTWGGRGVGMSPWGGGFAGGGGLLEHHATPATSKGQVLPWCVTGLYKESRTRTKGSSPFKESRTRTKHIVPLQISMQKQNSAPLAPWPPHHYLKTRGGGGGLGGVCIQGPGLAAPPPHRAVNHGVFPAFVASID